MFDDYMSTHMSARSALNQTEVQTPKQELVDQEGIAMSDGLVIPAGHGKTLVAGGAEITFKVTAEQAEAASTSSFEVLVHPGYDVGAHVHGHQEELFYILEGELDLFAFEPLVRTEGNWRTWQSRTGTQVFRGGPGSMMFVPPGCPHAFANPGSTSARMLFQATPVGHERYFEELLAILRRGGPPDPEVIASLRRRYDIEQLTPLVPGQSATSHEE